MTYFAGMQAADPLESGPVQFEGASAYEEARQMALHVVRETETQSFAPCSERHLQCVWYDPELRPARFKTSSGEWAVIEQPGIWNLEAGPDFLGAVLVLDGQRRISGDVEIHLQPSDWMRHGHQHDPRYKRVRFHVTYHAALPEPSLFPPGTVHIALESHFKGRPDFSFDAIDLTAYPYNVHGVAPPCRAALSQLDVARKAVLLDAAGEERLRRKTMRMSHAMRQMSPEAVLYREIFYALGYKHNKNAFRQLALLVPEERLRAEAQGNLNVAYALLAGVSGLLPEDLSARWPESSRQFIREIWDIWWKRREAWPERMEKSAWRLANIRPLNHPLRRFMAAAQLFASPMPLARRLADALTPDGAPDIGKMMGLFASTGSTWWEEHASLSGAAPAHSVGLTGDARAAAIVTNVLVPFFAATHPDQPLSAALLAGLPREQDNALIRQTAHALFGPDCPAALLGSTLRRQGLLQIFNDFCLTDRSRCAECPFPAMIKNIGKIS